MFTMPQSGHNARATLTLQEPVSSLQVRREMASTGKTHFWTEEETKFMLAEMANLNVLHLLDGRKYRNSETLKKVSCRMAEEGYLRTVEQVRCRWKSLRKTYYETKRKNNTSGSEHTSCPFFTELNNLLGSRPLSIAEESGVDVGFGDATVPSATVEPEDMESLEGEEEPDVEAVTPTPTDLPLSPQESGTTPKQPKRLKRSGQDHYINLERLQHQQQDWMAAQMTQQHQQQKEMMESLMDSNARSTERAVSLMLEGLQRMMPMSQVLPQVYRPPSFPGFFPTQNFPTQNFPTQNFPTQTFPTQNYHPRSPPSSDQPDDNDDDDVVYHTL